MIWSLCIIRNFFVSFWLPFLLYSRELFFRFSYLFLGYVIVFFLFYCVVEDLPFFFVQYSSLFCEFSTLQLITSRLTEVFSVTLFINILCSLYFYFPFVVWCLFCFFVEGIYQSSRRKVFFFLSLLFGSIYFVIPVFHSSMFVSWVRFFLSCHLENPFVLSYISFFDLVSVFVALDSFFFSSLFFFSVLWYLSIYRSWFLYTLIRDVFYVGLLSVCVLLSPSFVGALCFFLCVCFFLELLFFFFLLFLYS